MNKLVRIFGIRTLLLSATARNNLDDNGSWNDEFRFGIGAVLFARDHSAVRSSAHAYVWQWGKDVYVRQKFDAGHLFFCTSPGPILFSVNDPRWIRNAKQSSECE